MFTKQHYVADVLAGVLLAWLAWRLFLRGYSSPTIPRCEKRAAPVLLLATIGCWSIVVAGFGSYYWAVGPGFPSKETPKLPGIDLSSYVHGWDLCQLCGSKRERTDAAQSERLPEGTPW